MGVGKRCNRRVTDKKGVYDDGAMGLGVKGDISFQCLLLYLSGCGWAPEGEGVGCAGGGGESKPPRPPPPHTQDTATALLSPAAAERGETICSAVSR